MSVNKYAKVYTELTSYSIHTDIHFYMNINNL